LACAAARASQDPNLEHPHTLVTVKRGDYSIAALVLHRRGDTAFRHGVALFPGHPGILRLRHEGGEVKHELRGNFVVRSRRHWLDGETLAVLVDAPSDEWASFSQRFRETPRYGADVAALLEEVGRRFDVKDWTLVGTSEGSVSAFQVARMNPALAKRVILTSSVFSAGKNGPGLSRADWGALRSALLWVHHEDDPCRFTAYRDARVFAERTGAPLVTVRGGGPGRGNPCEAFSSHGFVGVEVEALAAMKAWIRSGKAPAQAGR
jgi:hypothetical protein